MGANPTGLECGAQNHDLTIFYEFEYFSESIKSGLKEALEGLQWRSQLNLII